MTAAKAPLKRAVRSIRVYRPQISGHAAAPWVQDLRAECWRGPSVALRALRYAHKHFGRLEDLFRPAVGDVDADTGMRGRAEIPTLEVPRPDLGDGLDARCI